MATGGPSPVTPGPGLGYQTKTPTPVGKKTQPPKTSAQAGAFLVPAAPRANSMTVSRTTFLDIDYNGTLLTNVPTVLNFTGNGVNVTTNGSNVRINIAGGTGIPTGPNNSVQFNNNGTFSGNSKLIFDPASGVLTVQGNVSANYFVGDATRLFNIPGPNVVGYIPSAATANVANVAGTVTTAAQPNITSVGTLTSVTVTGNITGGNVNTSGAVTGGNIRTGGSVSAVGNITGQYILGNGSFLSGLPATYNNSNVTGLLASFGSNPISTTGNVTAGYFVGNGSLLTGLPAVYGNSNVATLLAGFGSNVISTTGNITGGNLRTAGLISATGDITAGNVNAGASIVATSHTGATFSATGNITGGNVNTGGIVTATGNITGGNLRTVGQVTATGNVTGTYFIGNGSLLTGITANTTYSDSNVVTLLSSFGSNTVSTTGNITGGNIIGNIVGGGAGTPTIASTTNLDLSAAQAVRVIGGGTFRLPTLTTAQIANLTAVNGDMVYNSTTSKIQAYANNAWGNITLS